MSGDALNSRALRVGALTFGATLAALLFALACEPRSAENRQVSADTLIERSRRLSNLKSAELDQRCCAVASEAGPGPEPNVPANEDATPESFEILFDTGSAEVRREAERAVHALADYLILHPEIAKVELGGYADIHGTIESNERLGARRAEAVRRMLIRHSVAPDRLVTKSYGATAPVASSTTAKGMRLNRRVVIRIIEPRAAESATVTR